MDQKKLTNDEILVEARAFQSEVGRNTDRRGGRASSHMTPSGRGAGGRTSHGPVHKLATPEQFSGRPINSSPSVPRKEPATQHPSGRPAHNGEPMQVDPRPGIPRFNEPAAQPAGAGLVGSRRATSSSQSTIPRTNPANGFEGMEVDTDSNISKQDHAWKAPSSKPDGSAVPTGSIKDAGDAGVTMKQGKGFPLDTPQASNPRKGLRSSRWAMPSPVSPSNQNYPDPSTLQPIYRSDDWLADLSKENKAGSVKTRGAAESQPTPASRAVQPVPSWNTATEATKLPTCGATPQTKPSVRVNLPDAQAYANVQSPGYPVAPRSPIQSQTSDTRSGPSPGVPGENSAKRLVPQLVPQHDANAGPCHEPSRTPASARAASDQSPTPTTKNAGSGIFKNSTFMDWYNSQYMRRKP